MEENKKRTTTKKSKKPAETPVEAVEVEIQEAPAAPILKSVRVKTKQGGPLNIREDADIDSKKLGQILNGSVVNVETENISGFYKLADRDGYISGDLVETI